MKLFETFFTGLQRNQVISHIKEEVYFGSQYFLLLFLSVIIATLGLIINNNAIIIGAMLISPMIWPILGISVATVASTKGLLKKSILLLFTSIIFTIVTAYLISLISPFKDLGVEVLSRTNPTIFDLVIALAAGIAATFILLWPKFSNSLAGVAIAAALLPPICVTGIGIAFNDSTVAYGSFILFLTNLASIIFAGIIVFSLAKFYKRQDEDYVKRLGVGLFLSIVVIGFLSFQLVFSLTQIVTESDIKTNAIRVLSDELNLISNDITLEGVKIDRVSGGELDDGNSLNIKADIKVPSHIVITTENKNHIVGELQKGLDMPVFLQMRISQVVEAVTPNLEKIQKENYREIIENVISKSAWDISEDIEIQSIESHIELNGITKFFIETVWRVPEGIEVSYILKEKLSEDLNDRLNGEVSLRISVIPYTEISKKDAIDQDAVEYTKNILKLRVENFIKSVEDRFDIKYEYAKVLWDESENEYTLRLGLGIFNQKELSSEFIIMVRKDLGVIFSPISALNIDLELFRFEKMSI